MKRLVAMVLAALVILFTLFAQISIAEEDPVLVHAAELLQENVYLSNKLLNFFANLNANGEDTWFRVNFDWRDGNEGIDVMCSYTERSYALYPVDTLEKTRCLLVFLNHYEEISSMLPDGVELIYRIIEADGTKIDITSNNYKGYLKQYHTALDMEKNYK